MFQHDACQTGVHEIIVCMSLKMLLSVCNAVVFIILDPVYVRPIDPSS